MKHKKEFVALLIFFVISLMFVYPVFRNINNLGIHDWDQYLLYNGVPRWTILEFKQLPLWNPYYCGGNALLANPQSSFLNPLFIFVLIFGEVIGLKISIFIYLIIGLFGMFLLARYLKISLISSYLSAFLFMLSGSYAMHLSVGHTTWMQLALIPYVFLFYLKGLKEIKYIFLSALFMAFIFLGGFIHLLPFIAFFLIFYSVLATFKNWKKYRMKYLKNLIIIFLLFIFLSSIKLIPMLYFTQEYSFEKMDVQDNSFKKMIEALTFRDVESRMDYMYDYDLNGFGVAWGWHEYHSYIGLLPLILFLVGFVFLFRKEWPLVSIAIIFFLMALGDNAVINIWELLRQLPFISNLHGPSRILIMFVFPVSLIIGKFTSIFENKKKLFKFRSRKFNIFGLILILFVLSIFVDLFLVNASLFKHAFVVKPINIEKQEFTQITDNGNKAQYPTFLANQGIVNCYERVKPKLQAIPKFDSKTGTVYTNYIGEAYILENNKPQQITYFSPNKVKIKTNESGTLVLNQNYVNGWRIKNNVIKNVNGLIGAEVEKDKEVVFYYLPISFVFGSIISIISLIFSMILFFKFKNK